MSAMDGRAVLREWVRLIEACEKTWWMMDRRQGPGGVSLSRNIFTLCLDEHIHLVCFLIRSKGMSDSDSLSLPGIIPFIDL